MTSRASRALHVVVALVGGCTSPPSRTPPMHATAVVPEPAPAVQGDVVDSNGQPVAGALVSAWSHLNLDVADPAYDETSDEHGRFHFLSLPAGRYAVTATFPGKTGAYHGGVDVVPNEPPIHVSLHLSGAATTIEGTIRDETGAPARGARVIPLCQRA